MKNTDKGDLVLIAAFVLLPILMVNALFVFVIRLLGGLFTLYVVLGLIDLIVISFILMRTEIGQVIFAHFAR